MNEASGTSIGVQPTARARAARRRSPRPFAVLSRHALAICALALGGMAGAEEAPCDAFGDCLQPSEATRYLDAEALMEDGRWIDAAILLGAIHDERLLGEAPQNLLIANNYAVALSQAGREVDAALVLEAYFETLEGRGTAFANLLALYESVTRTGVEPPPRLVQLQPTPRAAAAPVVATRQAPTAPVAAAEVQARAQATPRPSEPERAVPLEDELGRALSAWATAWASGDLDAYVLRYAPSRSPVAGTPRDAWLAQRRERVRPDRNISIEISDLVIAEEQNGTARTDFTQRYRARGFEDQVRKRLVWRQHADGWRIHSEQVL